VRALTPKRAQQFYFADREDALRAPKFEQVSRDCLAVIVIEDFRFALKKSASAD
jgi:hypothetical protein